MYREIKKRNIILERSEDIIINFVKPDSRVLDLGCGEGQLLTKLKNRKNVNGVGIEIDSDNIIECVSKGVSVCHGNIDEGLTDYADNSFDYIIINNTLQQIFKPEFVIKEMLRVGKQIIIGFASFTFWKIRLSLLLNGKLPVTTFYQYQWYNTPNIRLISVKDFKDFCIKNDINIYKFYGCLNNSFFEMPFNIANFVSKYCIFICNS